MSETQFDFIEIAKCWENIIAFYLVICLSTRGVGFKWIKKKMAAYVFIIVM